MRPKNWRGVQRNKAKLKNNFYIHSLFYRHCFCCPKCRLTFDAFHWDTSRSAEQQMDNHLRIGTFGSVQKHSPHNLGKIYFKDTFPLKNWFLINEKTIELFANFLLQLSESSSCNINSQRLNLCFLSLRHLPKSHFRKINHLFFIIISLFCTVLSNAVLPWLAPISVWLVVGARVLTGLSDALLQPSTSSLITRWFPPKERPFAIGLITGGRQIGTH